MKDKVNGMKIRFRAALVMMVLVAASGPAWSSPTLQVEDPTNGLRDQNEPYLLSSTLGDFQVMMPSGCSKTRQLNNEQEVTGDEDPDIEAVQVVSVICDRNQKQGEGCSVTAFFNLTNGVGGPAGPAEVVRQIRKYLQRMSAVVESEQYITGSYPPGITAEGVEVRAFSRQGGGEIQIRGLLVVGNIYLLAAWKDTGGLDDDPVYEQFFNSFVPSAD